MRKLTGVTGIVAFVVCVPLLGMLLIKPDPGIRPDPDDDTSVINECFEVSVREENGIFYYKPEILTGILMYCVIPEEAAFTSSEDYIVKMDEVYDPEQEYLKALAIVCRSCIVAAWEAEQCPEVLDYDAMQFGARDFYRIIQADAIYTKIFSNTTSLPHSGMTPGGSDNRLNEIKQAVDATKGAVITRDGKVMAAPFFTTTPSGMLVGEAGDGVGFSLNFAYETAVSGMGFYEILKYFYDDIGVIIYE